MIIDTLISEFIEDMFDHFMKKKEEPAKLLAKEFPIDPDNKKNGNRSPAVDYLVAKGKDLYLVELKTDDASFKDSQLNRMCKVSGKNKAADLFNHYINVIVATEEKKKYRAQFRHIWFKLTGKKLNLKDSQITEYGLNKVICEKTVESEGNNNKIPETIKKDFENRCFIRKGYLTFSCEEKRAGFMNISNESIENMMKEMISFLKKWGLWYDTRIYALGKVFESTGEGEGDYNSFTDVRVTDNIDPAEYVETLYIGDEPMEHIFDMDFDSAFNSVLNLEVFETYYREIEGEEAWDFIFENSSFLQDFLAEHLGSGKDMLPEMISESGVDTVYTAFDPLEYDGFDEYEEMEEEYSGGNEKNSVPAYRLFDTYKDYKEFDGRMDQFKRNPELWDIAVRYVKNRLLKDDYIRDEMICIEGGPVISQIIKEFHDIFRKYGLWMELPNGGSVVGYPFDIGYPFGKN